MLAAVGVMLAVVVVVRWSGDRDPPAATPEPATATVAARAQVAAPVQPSTSTGASVATPTPSGASASAVARAPNAAPAEAVDEPMRLRVIAPASVKRGEVFTASIVGETAAAVRRYAFGGRFDAARLRRQGASLGDFMQNGGAFATLVEDAGESADGRLAIEVEQDGGSGVEGSGALAVLQFTAYNTGPASIALSRMEFVDGKGRRIMVEGAPTVVVSIEN